MSERVKDIHNMMTGYPHELLKTTRARLYRLSDAQQAIVDKVKLQVWNSANVERK